MNKAGKKIMMLVLALGLATSGLAVWQLLLEGTNDISITSADIGSTMTILSTETGGSFSADNAALLTQTTEMRIQNTNGAQGLELTTIDIVQTDVVDGCTDYLADLVSTEIRFDNAVTGPILVEGATFLMPDGLDKPIFVKQLFKHHSCPQKVETTLTFVDAVV